MVFITEHHLKIRARMQEAIDRKDAERGRSLTATEQLANLRHAMTHCDCCDADLGEPVACFCPKCGYETYM